MSSIFKKRACEVIDLKENGTFSAGQNVDALGWGKVVWPNHFGSSHPSKFLSLEGCLSRAAC